MDRSDTVRRDRDRPCPGLTTSKEDKIEPAQMNADDAKQPRSHEATSGQLSDAWAVPVGDEQGHALAGTHRQYESAPIGLCVFDLELRYVHINEWLARINGISVDAHVGRRISEVLPHVAQAVEPQLRRVIETGDPLLGGTAEAATPAHPGIVHRYRHNYVAVRGPDGSVSAVSVVVEDLGPCDPERAGLKALSNAELPESPSRELTAREAQILQLIATGLTSREVAERCEISLRTIDAHRRSLSSKLGISGTVALKEFACRSGLV